MHQISLLRPSQTYEQPVASGSRESDLVQSPITQVDMQKEDGLHLPLNKESAA